MTDDERSPDEVALDRFGLPPRDTDLPAIRAQLVEETTREAAGDARENATLALCVQLFAAGHVEDALLIWRAKRACFDAGGRIDVQLLCGAGFATTLAYLRGIDTDEARKALTYIEKCDAAGDFDGHDGPGGRLSQVVPFYRRYYRLWVDALRRGAVSFGDRDVALDTPLEDVAAMLGFAASNAERYVLTTPVLGFAEQPVTLTFENGKLARIACVDPSWRKQTGGWDDYDESIDFGNFKAGAAMFTSLLGPPAVANRHEASWRIGAIEVSVIYELRTPSVGIYLERAGELGDE